MSDWNNDESTTDLGFNLDDIEVKSFELIPPGRYHVVCTKAEVKTSKNNATTKQLHVEETIIDEDSPLRGRKIWSRYIVAHADGGTMTRGREDVKRLSIAYGVGGNDIGAVLHRECIAAVDVEPAKGDWEARNKVKKREAIAGQVPSAPSSPAAKPATPGKAAPAFLSRRQPQ